MKTVKSTIGPIISITILLFIIFTGYLNLIIEYVPLLWSLMIIWSIFYSIKYRKGRIKNEFRFLTNNDDHNKFFPFIIGLILVFGGICAIVYVKMYPIFSSLMVLNGFLLLVSGIVFIPSGAVWVKKNELNFSNGNQKENIKIDNLMEIALFPSKVTIIDKSLKKHTISHLNLKASDFSKIADFINPKLNIKVEINTLANRL